MNPPDLLAVDPRVLMVGSDDVFAYELISVLSTSDETIEVELADNLVEATAIGSAHQHDVVLIDLQSASARTSAPALQRLCQTSNAAVIVASNLAANAESAAAMAAGVEAFVVKQTEGVAGVARAVRVAIERRWASNRLAMMAYRDPLTGLRNRASFLSSVDEAIEAAGFHGRMAVMFIDLDGFKAVNDTYGHTVGDEMLRQIGARLRRRFPSPDVRIGRMGGDEFAMMVDRVRRLEEAVEIAEAVIATLGSPMTIAGIEHRVACRCGIALRPTSGRTREELVRSADEAMYAAKHGGGRIRVFLPDGTPQWGSNNQPHLQASATPASH